MEVPFAVISGTVPSKFRLFAILKSFSAADAVSAYDEVTSFVISWEADTANEAVTSSKGTSEPVPSASWPLDDNCNTLW